MQAHRERKKKKNELLGSTWCESYDGIVTNFSSAFGDDHDPALTYTKRYGISFFL